MLNLPSEVAEWTVTNLTIINTTESGPSSVKPPAIDTPSSHSTLLYSRINPASVEPFAAEPSSVDSLLVDPPSTQPPSAQLPVFELNTEAVSDVAVEQNHGRKRVCSMESWKKNVKKRLRNSGQEYVMNSGRKRESRKMKPGCGVGCRLKCHDRITENQRSNIFNDYWKLGDPIRQREYLAAHVKRGSVRRSNEYKKHPHPTRRDNVFKYELPNGNEKVHVCKCFFLDTLAICDRLVRTTFVSMSPGGSVATEKRGKHCRQRKIPAEIQKNMFDHIASFSTVESHYCRASSRKKYLPAHLSVAKMFEMFKKIQIEQSLKFGSLAKYRKIFDRDFNLGFFKPKKDQCDICFSYQNSSNQEKALKEASYKEHVIRKDEARSKKMN